VLILARDGPAVGGWSDRAPHGSLLKLARCACIGFQTPVEAGTWPTSSPAMNICTCEWVRADGSRVARGGWHGDTHGFIGSTCVSPPIHEANGARVS